MDKLGLTDQEIQDVVMWEGTRWAKERWEKENGQRIRDTTGIEIAPAWVAPERRKTRQAMRAQPARSRTRPRNAPRPAVAGLEGEIKDEADGFIDDEPVEDGDGTEEEDEDEDEDTDTEVTTTSVGFDLNRRLRAGLSDAEYEAWLKEATENDLSSPPNPNARPISSHVPMPGLMTQPYPGPRRSTVSTPHSAHNPAIPSPNSWATSFGARDVHAFHFRPARMTAEGARDLSQIAGGLERMRRESVDIREAMRRDSEVLAEAIQMQRERRLMRVETTRRELLGEREPQRPATATDAAIGAGHTARNERMHGREPEGAEGHGDRSPEGLTV
jgi:hypothetical protein